jgi:hypothetical protein
MIKKAFISSCINCIILYIIIITISILYFFIFNPRPTLNFQGTIYAGLRLSNFYHTDFNIIYFNILFYMLSDIILFFVISVLMQLVKIKSVVLFSILLFYLIKILFIFYAFHSGNNLIIT